MEKRVEFQLKMMENQIQMKMYLEMDNSDSYTTESDTLKELK